MKIIKPVLFLLIALFATFGSNTYAASINVVPTSPDTNDFIVANIAGSYNTAGYIFESAELLNITNNSVNLNLFIDAPSGFVAQIIMPYSYNIDLGFLESGVYSISADIYFDGLLGNTVSNTFTVSPVPIPASVWLFFSGLLSILSFSKLNKKS